MRLNKWYWYKQPVWVWLIFCVFIHPTWANCTTLDDLFAQAASDANVPLRLLRAVCWVESNHRANPPLKLDGGTPSYGMCQVKLKAAKDTGYVGTVMALRNPDTNIAVAAHYLRLKLEKYGDWKRAVTAYHCGHYNVGMSVINPYVMLVALAMAESR